MSLGPVKHKQPGVPESFTIENYHQFNKCFVHELDTVENRIKDCFFNARDNAYQDKTPHRHKIKGKIPLFSIHLDATAGIRRYSYVQSRFFYCWWYEKLASVEPAFKFLQTQLAKGINLCICGYDAHEPYENMYKVYCDESKPFGHEMVLYCLLKGVFPWKRYYEEHIEIYDPVSFLQDETEEN